MISLAIFGVFQALMLPGLLAILWAFRSRPQRMGDVVILATPLSIIINYVVVAGLVAASMYTQAAVITIGAIEITALFAYLWWQPTQQAKSGVGEISAAKQLERRNYLLLQLAALLQLLLAYAPVFGTAIWYSDAGTTWNRWAQEWFEQAPKGSWGYPPGLPILYSLVYKFAGTTDVQVVAKLVATYFPFFGLLCIWRIGAVSSQWKLTSLIAGGFYAFLLLRGYEEKDFSFQGFTDPVIGALSAYALWVMVNFYEYFRAEEKNPQQSRFLLIPMTVGLAAAALIKQNGVMVCAAALAGINCYYFSKYRTFNIRILVGSMAIFLIALNWYIFSYFHYNDFVRASFLLDSDLGSRLSKALQLTIYSTRPLVVIFFVIGVAVSSWARWHLILYGMPLWFFWAILVSYDYRSAYMVIPTIALISGMGLQYLWSAWPRWFAGETPQFPELVKIARLIKGSPVKKLALLGLVLVALPFLYPDQQFLKDARQRRIEANNVGNNEYLVELLAKASANEKLVVCNDDMWALPGARGKMLVFSPCGDARQRWLNDPESKYFYLKQVGSVPFERSDFPAETVTNANPLPFRLYRMKGDYLLYEKCPCQSQQ